MCVYIYIYGSLPLSVAPPSCARLTWVFMMKGSEGTTDTMVGAGLYMLLTELPHSGLRDHIWAITYECHLSLRPVYCCYLTEYSPFLVKKTKLKRPQPPNIYEWNYMITKVHCVSYGPLKVDFTKRNKS